MKRPINSRIWLALACLVLAGCGFLAARPDPSRFFTLSPLSHEDGASFANPGSGEQISLGLGPIKFPTYLDRDQLVTRKAQNRFEVSENDRWAEPLEENFTRVLLQNVSALLPAERIVAYPWPSNGKPNYQIEIEVVHFESNGARDAQLLARWTVIDASNRKTLSFKESRLTRPAKEKSTDATVAALSETVADLSRQIADVVRTIQDENPVRPSTHTR